LALFDSRRSISNLYAQLRYLPGRDLKPAAAGPLRRWRFFECANMTVHLYQPLQPLAADGAALGRVLHAAGVDKDDLIRVVGPSGPIAALWLSRHGYDRAVYVRSAAAVRGLPADALLIAQPCAAEDLGALIGDGEGLADGGALIVQTRPGRQGEETEAVAALLRRLGFIAQRQLNDKGRPICIARRVGFPSATKAA
jgi:hypothetical protein